MFNVSRFLDATAAQLENGDRTCIICMEEMVLPGPKVLPCGHMLHLHCLRSWMERQQVRCTRLVSSRLLSSRVASQRFVTSFLSSPFLPQAACVSCVRLRAPCVSGH